MQSSWHNGQSTVKCMFFKWRTYGCGEHWTNCNPENPSECRRLSIFLGNILDNPSPRPLRSPLLHRPLFAAYRCYRLFRWPKPFAYITSKSWKNYQQIYTVVDSLVSIFYRIAVSSWHVAWHVYVCVPVRAFTMRCTGAILGLCDSEEIMPAAKSLRSVHINWNEVLSLIQRRQKSPTPRADDLLSIRLLESARFA